MYRLTSAHHQCVIKCAHRHFKMLHEGGTSLGVIYGECTEIQNLQMTLHPSLRYVHGRHS